MNNFEYEKISDEGLRVQKILSKKKLETILEICKLPYISLLFSETEDNEGVDKEELVEALICDFKAEVLKKALKDVDKRWFKWTN